ncbi:MAG TPA: hypothetical protein VK013_00520 [Myxococcaceae bacterium]|nr:hypothetical protein [Myxococcaceae bacterium]
MTSARTEGPGSGRHRQDGFRALGSALVVVLALSAVVLLGPRLLGGTGFSSPDARIQGLLHDALRDGTLFDIPGSDVPLRAGRVRSRLPTVDVLDADRAVAVITLDVTGTFGDTQVSSLGWERIPFERDARGRWHAPQGMAPRLTASLAALESRRAALEAGASDAVDALSTEAAPPAQELSRMRALQALADRRYDVEAWLLRSERDRVEVAERYRVRGTLPERPVDEKGLRNLTLVPSADGEGLLFSPPLM